MSPIYIFCLLAAPFTTFLTHMTKATKVDFEEEQRLGGIKTSHVVGNQEVAKLAVVPQRELDAANARIASLEAKLKAAGIEASYQYSCVGLDDGTQDIYLGGARPIRVTCEEGWVALELQPQENAKNGWMVSYDNAGNDWFKCSCSKAFADESLSGLSGLKSHWKYGTAVHNEDLGFNSQECQVYTTFNYISGGHILSTEELQRLSENAGHYSYDRNFDVTSISCDDDNQVYPRGNWMAFEESVGSNKYTPYHCSGAGSDTCCQLNDMKAAGMSFDTYPMPRQMCASINTGGGVAVAFVEKDGSAPRTSLRIKPQERPVEWGQHLSDNTKCFHEGNARGCFTPYFCYEGSDVTFASCRAKATEFGHIYFQFLVDKPSVGSARCATSASCESPITGTGWGGSGSLRSKGSQALVGGEGFEQVPADLRGPPRSPGRRGGVRWDSIRSEGSSSKPWSAVRGSVRSRQICRTLTEALGPHPRPPSHVALRSVALGCFRWRCVALSSLRFGLSCWVVQPRRFDGNLLHLLLVAVVFAAFESYR